MSKANINNVARVLNKAVAVRTRGRGRARKNAVTADAIGAAKLRNDLLPELQVTECPIGDLKLPQSRLRKAEEEHIIEVMRSIQTLGVCRPVIADRHGKIIDGQIVYLAAQRLGLDRLPVIVIEHLDETEVRLLSIALNRLAEKGSWDLDALKVEIEELIEIEADVQITGLSGEEIDLIVHGDGEDDAEDEPTPNRDAPAITQLGDEWLACKHKFRCADAREAANYDRLCSGAPSARIVLSDPPFGCPIAGLVSGNGAVQHPDFIDGSGGMTSEELEVLLTAFLNNACQHLVDGGLLFVFMDYRELETLLRVGRLLGLKLVNILVWDKGRGGMGGLFRNACEFVGLFKFGTAPHLNRTQLGRHGRDRTTVLTYPGATTAGSSANAMLHDHPTPKSVELLVDLIIDTTERGEIILDPFLGSGTAIMAAQKTGRVVYGLELDPHYCDVIIRRFEKTTGIEVVHAATGKTFAQVAAERAAEACAAVDADMPTTESVRSDATAPVAQA